MDAIDRALLAELQRDATQSYVRLGATVGLAAGSTHDRVRKLRERGTIRATTIDVDPAAVGRGVLAFVMLEAASWMGDESTARALRELPEVEEAHVIAGAASLLIKVRTPTTESLQATLRRLYAVDGVTGTQTIVVLETLFERPVDPSGAGVERSSTSAGRSASMPARERSSSPSPRARTRSRQSTSTSTTGSAR